MTSLELAIIADDLSGAAESASAALLRVSRSMVLLSDPTRTALSTVEGGVTESARSIGDGGRVVTVDTHSRSLSPERAADAVRLATRQVAEAPVVVKKVDSLLRGNLAAEIGALRDELGRTPVVAVSLPRLGRVVSGGVLHVDDVPLHETDLWSVEGRMPLSSLPEALAPLRTWLVSQAVVDAGVEAIAAELRLAEADGAVVVCDAADDASLARIVEAAENTWAQTLLVGSAALVAAAVARLEAVAHEPVAPQSLPQLDKLLIALGTRASTIGTQLERLASSAAYVQLLDPTTLLSGDVDLTTLPTDGLVVVAIDPSAPADPANAAALAAAFASEIAPVAREFAGVYLSGGETARAVLDLLGVDALTVEAELEPGTVLSATSTGQVVVTRPGSFGDADSLIRTARQLLRGAATTKEFS